MAPHVSSTGVLPSSRRFLRLNVMFDIPHGWVEHISHSASDQGPKWFGVLWPVPTNTLQVSKCVPCLHFICNEHLRHFGNLAHTVELVSTGRQIQTRHGPAGHWQQPAAGARPARKRIADLVDTRTEVRKPAPVGKDISTTAWSRTDLRSPPRSHLP